MKIAVNTRLLLKDKLEGIGWFTYETFKRIVLAHPEHEFIFLFDRPYKKEFIFAPNVKPLILFPPARNYYLWYSWFEYSVPWILKKQKADLFVSPDGYLSLRTKVPSTLVVHDLAFEHRPQDVTSDGLKWYKKYMPQYVEKASRIATVSEFSKADIVGKYDADPSRIDVVYNGANTIYEPVNEYWKKETQKLYTKGHEYFIFVGAIQPRKNLMNLFKAFDDFKATDRRNIKLVIVGRKAWNTNEIFEVYESMKFKEHVIFTGRVSTIELKNLLGSALALTYVPFFEGFGIPIIEAQACGTPVITSNITSMPEASGEAALLVNPYSYQEISQAMHKIAGSEELRKDLVQRGSISVKKFSWDKTADKLWQTMMNSLS
ncbi:MAG: glycosyltransferase family 4 protein [Cytophagaceae bacterium]